MIHETENREDLELHLKANGKKFSKQCVRLMEDMYRGRRLNSMIVTQEYKYNDRRLRDCRQHRPDIVKSVWLTDENNNTRFVEYWIDRPVPPSKQESILWATNLLDKMKDGVKQGGLFE